MPENKEKKSLDPTVLAAIIGGIVTIAATVITVIATRPAAATPVPVQVTVPVVVTATNAPALPTDTVPAGDPTSTPAPTATDTPVPTFTFTAAPSVEIGQDWGAGCISSSWKPYPSTISFTEDGKGCLNQPVHVFSTDKEGLSFLAARSENGPEEIYGLFAPLPTDGSSATIHVLLKELTNVDIWMGVFQEPDLASQGLLMTVPANDKMKNFVVAQKDPSNYKTLRVTQNLDQGPGFSITFKYDKISVGSSVDPSVMVINSISVPSSQKWLFIGYKGLKGTYSVTGQFFGLEFK